MSFSSSSNGSSSSSDVFILASSNEKILEDMDQDDLMTFQMMLVTICNFNEFFTSHEMEEGIRQSMDIVVSVWDILVTMWVTPRLFYSLGASTEIEVKNHVE